MEIQDLREENKALQSEISSLRSEFELCNEEIYGLRSEFELCNKEIYGLRLESGTLKTQNRTLRFENELCKKDIDVLRQENENLKSQNAALREENENLKSEISTLSSEPQQSRPEVPIISEKNGKPLVKLGNSGNLTYPVRDLDLRAAYEKKKKGSTEPEPKQQETLSDQPEEKNQEENLTKVPQNQSSSVSPKTTIPRTKTRPKESVVSIGIDFGTAFTGYSFGFKGAKQVRQPKWGEEYGLNTPKTPTCILFDGDQNFLKFGYDAIMTYTRQTRKNEAMKQYLFDNFKMELYGKVLHRDSMMTSQNRKRMRAIKVFSESLRFMKDHALDMIGRHTAGVKYSASDATWVLTVPAIWSVAAKQFMREAATEAGLVTESEPERLIIALEPEAASVWCKQLPGEGFMEGDLKESQTLEQVTGTQYMVVDCGGGTIDVTVHEVVERGCLKELHRVSGNSIGGQTVDMKFKSFLRELFSEVLDEFEENHPNEMKRLMYDFSICKRYEGDVLVQCPYNLQELASKAKDMEAYFEGNADADWDSGQILLSGEKLRSLHEECLRGINSLIEEILEKQDLKIRYIFLVGGFALSPYVNSFVKEKFGKKYQVLCPADADMAVVKGAVMFGTMPDIVESRI